METSQEKRAVVTDTKSGSAASSAKVDEIMLHGIAEEEGSVQFVYANPRCEELYGFSPDALLRSTHVLMEHIHGEDRKAFELSIQKARVQNAAWEWEGRLVHPKGGHSWIRVMASPQEGAEGRRWHGFFHDVTRTGRAARGNVTLQAFSRLLATRPGPQEVQDGLARVLSETTEYSVAIVDRLTADGTGRRAISGLEDIGTEPRIDMGEGTVFHLVTTTQELYECPDARKGGSSLSSDPFVQMGAGGILAVPVVSQRGVLGVITLLDWERKKMDSSLRVTLETVASLLSQYLERRVERKTAEESLERFGLALEGTSDGLWDVKLETVQTWSTDLPMYFSGGFNRLFKLHEDEFTPSLSSWASRVHPDDMERVGTLFVRHLQSRTPFDIEHRIVMPNEEIRWFNVRGHGLWNEQDKLCRLAGSLRDITSRKEMEGALQRSQKEYRMLVERLPLGVVIVQQGIVAYANTAFQNTLGSTVETPLRRTAIVDSVVAEDQEFMAFLVDETLQKRDHAPREIRFQHRDGGEVTLEVSQVKQVRFRGNTALMLTTRDISEQKEMEAKLYLADRLSSMGTIAAGMAHEINNPLSFISGNLDYMLDELETLEDDDVAIGLDKKGEWIHALKDARNGGQRVARIVRDLKTFSRMGEEQLEAVEIGEVLDTTLVMAQNHLRHRATLVRMTNEVPAIWSCPTRLGQVLLNLVLNSIQSFANDDPSENRIEVTVESGSNDWVTVRVQDNGVGIPPHLLSRIFDPFFTTKPAGLGTGLGLSICHQLVSSLGGSIAVESTLGEGTTFEVNLPKSKEAIVAAEQESRRRLPISTDCPARVLVIDDEERVGQVLSRGLKHHQVRATTRGSEALKWIESGEDFDVVFCDVMMPEVNGMDMHARLAELNPALAAKVVFMTGGAFSQRARQFLDAVENRVIEKPFDIRAVQALVASSTLS